MVEALRAEVPVAQLCEHLGLPRSAWYRSNNRASHQGLGESQEAKQELARAPSARPTPPNALKPAERAQIRETLNGPDFVELAIPAAHTKLLDEGTYLASVSTFYRIMRSQGEVHERRDQVAAGPRRAAPVLQVTGPNQVWSWDITKLLGYGIFYCLYVVLDIFSRYVVGWMVAEQQSAELGGEVIQEAMRREGLLIGPDQSLPAHALTTLSDNGGPMIAKPMVELMDTLGVRQVHSRPHTPNDNPYSESQFRTMKYRPEYPDRFGSVLDARGWGQTFFQWYNHAHYHSGIGMLPPAVVHRGQTESHLELRRKVMALAFNDHPDRFHHRMPNLKGPPTEVWLNRPANIPGLVYPTEFTKF